MADVGSDVERFLEGVTPARRQRDARTMLELMTRVTGQSPVVDRGMVGFGTYHYEYASGHQGTTSAAGFAPRKHALVVYVMDGVSAHEERLARLGPHTSGVGCIYIKDLDKVDLAELERIVATSYATVTEGTYRLRAREGEARP